MRRSFGVIHAGHRRDADEDLTMPRIFQACILVLRETLDPMHYKTLTELALQRLGYDKTACRFDKISEDVREKLLVPKRYGTAYFNRNGHYRALLQEWFLSPQLCLLNLETAGFIIPANLHICVEGAMEAILRFAHMRRHTHISDSRHAQIVARGLLLEKHVTAWFRCRWPEEFLEAENAGVFTRACNHDFRLQLSRKLRRQDKSNVYTFDVAGPNSNGTFGKESHSEKPFADFHIFSAIQNSRNVVVYGFLRGEELKWRGVVRPEQVQPFSYLVLSLECLRLGLSYADMWNVALASANGRRVLTVEQSQHEV